MADPIVDSMKEWKAKKAAQDPIVQSMAKWKAAKAAGPSYKSKDFISNAVRLAAPFAGQVGGEMGGAALGTLAEGGIPGPGTAAGFIGGGGAGGAAGESAADYVDYKRGMGPKPTWKGQASKLPVRAGISALGSALGAFLPKLVQLKGEGISDTLANNIMNFPKTATKQLIEHARGGSAGGFFRKFEGSGGATGSFEKAAGQTQKSIASAGEKSSAELEASRAASKASYTKASQEAEDAYEKETTRRKTVAASTDETNQKLYEQRKTDLAKKGESANKRLGEKLQMSREKELQVAMDRTEKTSKAIGEHYKESGYEDPVRKAGEPIPEPKIEEFQKKYGKEWFKPYEQAQREFSKGPVPIKKTSLDPNSLYARYTKAVKERASTSPQKQVPKEVGLLQDMQDVLHSRETKLSRNDTRLFGKFTNELSESIGNFDPKLQKLRSAHAEAMKNLGDVKAEISTRKTPKLEAEVPEKPSKATVQPVEKTKVEKPAEIESSGSQKRNMDLAHDFGKGEEGIGALSDALRTVGKEGRTGGKMEDVLNKISGMEKETGANTLDKTKGEFASNFFKRVMPQTKSPAINRVLMTALPLAAYYQSQGKPLPRYLSGMLMMAGILSPRMMAHSLTTLPRFAGEGLSSLSNTLADDETKK